jgi:transcriptional regulator with XRE-family HTH domain
MAVGQRLQRRRTALGLSVASVADWAGVPAETYAGYERGRPIPASLLAQVAELLEMPLSWFFEGVVGGDSDESDFTPDAEPPVYRVTTVDQRIEALAEAFRQLDFEGQQHLLAISQALRRSNARVRRS